MKKVFLIVLLLLVGCTNNYDNFVLKARDSKNTNEFPFDINFYFDDGDDTLIYQVVVDNVKYDLNEVKMIVIHDKKDENEFPSIGVLDDTISLNDKTKGVNLIGHVLKQNIEFKVYIEANNSSYAYIYRYNMP